MAESVRVTAVAEVEAAQLLMLTDPVGLLVSAVLRVVKLISLP